MSLFAKDLIAWEERGGSLTSLRTELDARETPISCIDPYSGWHPGHDPRAATGERAAFLKATEEEVLRFAEVMGASDINLVAPYDRGEVRFDAIVDGLGRFADLAAEAGLRAQLEIVPTSGVSDLGTAMRLLTAVGRRNVGVLLDTYNLARSGVTPRDIDDVPHELVFSVQLADGDAVPLGGDYRLDSLHNRQLPGEGELPVAEMVERLMQLGPLPPLGPEVFRDALCELPADEIGSRCADATRRFLQGVGAVRFDEGKQTSGG